MVFFFFAKKKASPHAHSACDEASFCYLILLFSLFLLLFMGITTLFNTIQEFYYTISNNFYFYFSQKFSVLTK